MKKTRIVFVGGAIRAVSIFKHVAQREDVTVELAIFMRGYENEWRYNDRLEELAKEFSVPFITADTVSDAVRQRVMEIRPDMFLGGGTWRSMLDDDFLGLAKDGYLTMHGSGLPEYRGWCPVNWYIINGEKELVCRFFQLNSGVDAGPLLVDGDGKHFEFRMDLDGIYIGEAMERLSQGRLDVYSRFLTSYARGEVAFMSQDESKATFGCNRNPDDGNIDWNWGTDRIYNFIRGQSEPCPGAFSFFRNEKFHIWRAEPIEPPPAYVGRVPGKVVERTPDGVSVLTGDGVIRLTKISVDGREVVPSQYLSSVRETLGFDGYKALEECREIIREIRQQEA